MQDRIHQSSHPRIRVSLREVSLRTPVTSHTPVLEEFENVGKVNQFQNHRKYNEIPSLVRADFYKGLDSVSHYNEAAATF